jgi:hypothetical protein
MNPDDPRSLERASTGELLKTLNRLPKGPQRAAVAEELQRRHEETTPKTVASRRVFRDGSDQLVDEPVQRFDFSIL